MDGFIDIHSHVLPNMDDGAKSMDEAINMIQIALNEGIDTIIATPHFKSGKPERFTMNVEQAINKVKTEINDMGFDFHLYIGSEIFYSETSLNALISKSLPTMADSRYVLLEFHPMWDYQYIKSAINRILWEGYLPIMAHVERYMFVQDSIERVKELMDLGAFIQINASSIFKWKNHREKKISRKLLKNRWVHFVSTDAHGDKVRQPLIRKCADFIIKKHGEDYAYELLIKNPKRIINYK